MMLNEAQIELQDMIRKYANREIAKHAPSIDQTNQVPYSIYKQLGAMDVFRILISEENGGLGRSLLDFVLITEELAKISASVAWQFMVTHSVSALIQQFGTQSQIRTHLPDLIDGGKSAAFAMTESGSATNWQKTMQSKAVSQNRQIKLTGTKSMISNSVADSVVVIVRNNNLNDRQPFLAFLMKKDLHSFYSGTLETMLGLRGSAVGELVLDDVIVSTNDILGKEGQFSQILQTNTMMNCLGQAAVALGISQAAFQSVLQYTKKRMIAENQYLADFESIQRALTDIKQSIDAARLMLYHAASIRGIDVFLATLKNIETALSVTDRAMTLMGGHGCMQEYPMERYYRDAKTVSLQKPVDHIKSMVGEKIVRTDMN